MIEDDKDKIVAIPMVRDQEGNVTSFADRNGHILMGTSEGFIHEYSGTSLIRSYDLSDRGGGIFFMFNDSKNNIWVCQAPSDKPISGLAKLQGSNSIIEYDIGPQDPLHVGATQMMRVGSNRNDH